MYAIIKMGKIIILKSAQCNALLSSPKTPKIKNHRKLQTMKVTQWSEFCPLSTVGM